MSYVIYTNSGTVLTTVPTGKLNTNTVSLTLVGRNASNYGQYFNQNFVDLLANFASPAYVPPQNPTQGQLWYDTTSRRLKVFDPTTGFVIINGPAISTRQPSGQLPGEFWFDPANERLSFLSNDGQYVSWSTFPTNDVSGWTSPVTPVLDANSSTVDVTLLQSYGSVVGVLTTASFTANLSNSIGVFALANTSSFSAVGGLTIIGDIKATGSIISGTGQIGSDSVFETTQVTNVYAPDPNSGHPPVITTSTDLLVAPDEGFVFDLLPYADSSATCAIKIIDSQNDGYGPDNSTLNVGRIYHNYGVFVIEADGSIYNNTDPTTITPSYGQLVLKNLTGGAQVYISQPTGSTATTGIAPDTVTISAGNILAGDRSNWVFGNDGRLTVPGIVQFPNVAQIDATGTNAIFKTLNSFVIQTEKAIPNGPSWTFDNSGVLTLPNGAKVSSTVVSDGVISTYNYDCADLTVDVTPSTTIDFPNFSGQILINDYVTGQVDLWLAGGGYAYKLGSSKTGNGDATLGTIVHNDGISGYTWTSSVTGTMSFVATRTRSGA